MLLIGLVSTWIGMLSLKKKVNGCTTDIILNWLRLENVVKLGRKRKNSVLEFLCFVPLRTL